MTVQGAQGHLQLRFSAPVAGQPTQLTVQRQDSPLQVVRAFRTADGAALVHLHNLSGGVLGGDRLHVEAEIGPRARAQLTTTGATRVYRQRPGLADAAQVTRFHVREGALLESLPDPLIPYAGSRYRQETTIDLAQYAGLFYWEVMAPGRLAHGELFQFAALTLDLAISAGELPISLERFQLEPALRPPQSLVRLGGYRYSATFYACRVGAPVATWQALEERLTHSAQTLSQPGEMLWGVSALVAHGAGPVIGSIEPGKLADLVLSKPAFFGVKPEMVVKGGLIAWSVMGDANASIPTPQPVLYRPMFGSFGKATAATSVTFLSQATVEAGIPEQLGLAKGIVPVEKCRTVGKADMIHNNATPLLEVDPETYEVRADGELLTCEPASELPMAQRYFLF